METQHLSVTETIFFHQGKAEKLFMGGVFLDEEFARRECGWLPPAIITNPGIRRFWELILNGRTAADAAMEAQVYFDAIEALVEVPSYSQTPAYADAISMDHYLRQSGMVLSEMARAIVARNAGQLRSLAQGIIEQNPISGMAIPSAVDIGLEFIADLDDIKQISERTGITSLDKATGGLEKQTLTILAARPSMGKSALAIQIARYKAGFEKKNVLFFSLEMKPKSIWARMACGDLEVSWRDIREDRVSGKEGFTREDVEEQKQAVADKSSALIDELEERLRIDGRPKLSMDDVWRAVSHYQPDFVVIDHLGLLRMNGDDEVRALGEASWAGKAMAKEFDIPVLMLYQLNRNTEGRENKRPTMSDLRGSGKIEENADNILLMYRSDYYEGTQQAPKTVSDTEIIIAKFRDGKRNLCVDLEYHLAKQRFFSRRLP